MTDTEKLDLLISDLQGMKSDLQGMKSDLQNMDLRIKSLELHIENGTDKNIQLIAENFIELTKTFSHFPTNRSLNTIAAMKKKTPAASFHSKQLSFCRII